MSTPSRTEKPSVSANAARNGTFAVVKIARQTYAPSMRNSPWAKFRIEDDL